MVGWLRRTADAVREKLGSIGRRAELLARYKRLRRAGVALNNRLIETLSRSVLDEGGKKLGILKGNVLALDSEDELSVLMDYCIFDVRRGGLNAVERYLKKSPPPPDSDDGVLLQAMRQARYSLFAAEALEPGLGVHVRDLLADEPLFLVDVGFSRTAPVGMILAARVMAPESITITTGAALPVGILSAEERVLFLQLVGAAPGLDPRALSPQEASERAGRIIRTCLRQGAAGRISYLEPEAADGRGPGAKALRRDVGRNGP